jgi:phosphoglycolate phosphatase-like HAD superfamily hydrolase
MRGQTACVPTVLLDVDGTLVDSNYQHVIAWQRALRDHGLVPGAWRIHRHIGMGGDQLVPALVGQDVDDEIGDEIRDGWEQHVRPLLDDVTPVDGARELVHALTGAGAAVVLASSGKAEHLERWLDLLDLRGQVDAVTTSADAERTKPHPDVFRVAMERVDAGAEDTVALGDSTWDCEAAGRIGVRCYGLVTGGFSEAELQDAGAAGVLADLHGARHALLRAVADGQ